MITSTSLPNGYKPYKQLNICSNIIKEGGHLLILNGVLPLVIGQGDTPLVWLSAPTDQSGDKFVELVAASVAKHPAANVRCESSGVSLLVGMTRVLHVMETEQGVANVDLLDFRPIGMNIFGDSLSINAGGTTLSTNTYIGSGALLAFGT